MKIAVLGTSCIDRVILARNGLVNFQTTTQVTETDSFGGSMHNVAYHLGVLGLDCHFISKFGNDDLSKAIINDLKTNGVTCHSVLVDAPCPIFSCIQDIQKKMYLSSVDSRYFFDEKDQIDSIILNDIDYGITDNNNPIFLKSLLDANKKIKWILNARQIDYSLMKNLEGYILNREEAKRYEPELNQDEFAKKCLDAGLKWIVITMDKDGLCFYNQDTKQHFSSLTGGQGVTLGCGDAFSTGMLYGLSKKLNPLDSVIYGLKASAIIYKLPSATSKKIVKIKI